MRRAHSSSLRSAMTMTVDTRTATGERVLRRAPAIALENSPRGIPIAHPRCVIWRARCAHRTVDRSRSRQEAQRSLRPGERATHPAIGGGPDRQDERTVRDTETLGEERSAPSDEARHSSTGSALDGSKCQRDCVALVGEAISFRECGRARLDRSDAGARPPSVVRAPSPLTFRRRTPGCGRRRRRGVPWGGRASCSGRRPGGRRGWRQPLRLRVHR